MKSSYLWPIPFYFLIRNHNFCSLTGENKTGGPSLTIVIQSQSQDFIWIRSLPALSQPSCSYNIPDRCFDLLFFPSLPLLLLLLFPVHPLFLSFPLPSFLSSLLPCYNKVLARKGAPVLCCISWAPASVSSASVERLLYSWLYARPIPVHCIFNPRSVLWESCSSLLCWWGNFGLIHRAGMW